VNIVELERTRLRAIVDVDHRALEDLHHPDFVLCTPSGDLWDRQTYLNGLYDGSIDYACFEPQSDIQVEASPSLAVVRYLSVINITTSGGGGHLECWHLDVYVRDDEGSWRCKWSQATDTIRD
jgi:ketosteroid isomerase-like protein